MELLLAGISFFFFRMLQLLKRSLWKVSFKETQPRFIHRRMVKKGHVLLVMYELLQRVSMDYGFFSSKCYPGQIIPWGEINIKSLHHLVSTVGFVLPM